MSLSTWWLFVVTVFLLCGTPGPNMLHILSRSVSVGARRSWPAMAGCLSAVLLVLCASAAGLGALLLASSKVFEALRYAGVAYLLWLGIRSWRSGDAPLDVSESNLLDGSLSRASLFRGGLLVSLSNPKLLLFATAFLPQFVNRAQPQLPQFALLVASFGFCELFWYLTYAFGGQQLRRHLSRPALRRWFDRATGAIFLGFGVLLLRYRPQ